MAAIMKPKDTLMASSSTRTTTPTARTNRSNHTGHTSDMRSYVDGHAPNLTASEAHTFTHNGHTLTWQEHSSGDHTLIFFHGWSIGQTSWKLFMPSFTHLGRCVTIDLPYHHPATAPTDGRPFTQEEFIELEARAVKHICGDGPVTLIGHSAGGIAALGAAYLLGEQVKQVVTVSSVVWGHFTGIVRSTKALLEGNFRNSFKSVWRMSHQGPWMLMLGLSSFVHQQPAFWGNQLAWQMCDEIHTWYHHHSVDHLETFLDMLFHSDIRPILPMLQTPVLVINGAYDPVVSPQQSYWLAEHLPNAELRDFDQTGHIPQLESPRAFERVMLEWLEPRIAS
jgi:pimeloyl-ACP methyl ester carboxylesterase